MFVYTWIRLSMNEKVSTLLSCIKGVIVVIYFISTKIRKIVIFLCGCLLNKFYWNQMVNLFVVRNQEIIDSFIEDKILIISAAFLNVLYN